ncbi:cupin domain-containing protein [Rhodoblastus sp.]|uniref:cupin domain-containing protein n=2 Tax=Rhodoblastus sp. TaxID=1962975 RepID=UPI003F97B9B7
MRGRPGSSAGWSDSMHDADDEFFYILEGELTIVSPDGESKAGAGAWVGLPRKSAHGFHNASDKPARMLVVLSPGVQALEMFRNFDQAGQSARLAPEAIMEIAGEYGVCFA